MVITITEAKVRGILTRATGFLKTVTSHSLQPYRGCTYGNTLCGAGCYVQHNRFLTRDAPWGSFLEARVNAAEIYRAQNDRERRWARRARGGFSVFMSSSTDPFVPQERRFGITREVLEAMRVSPPDLLIIQTHTSRVTDYLDLYPALAKRCELRFHITIESDRDRLDGLPPPTSSVADRFEAAASLKARGLRVAITVSPLLPIADPEVFFREIERHADAAVIDHFIGGDGSTAGARTLKTPLPAAMARIDPGSTSLAYRDRMVALASRIMPGRVGVCVDGFAGRYLPPP